TKLNNKKLLKLKWEEPARTQDPTVTNYDVGSTTRADLKVAPLQSAMEIMGLLDHPLIPSRHGELWISKEEAAITASSNVHISKEEAAITASSNLETTQTRVSEIYEKFT
ncbi:hypothetical protein CR513_57571, partial [Mucuna pruriens]